MSEESELITFYILPIGRFEMRKKSAEAKGELAEI